MSSAERARGSAGFTLVEVLVALVLAGLLAGILFQIVRGQARFSTVQSAQQEVQQNARGAIEILSSDLRGIQPQGLISTSANSLLFLLPRVWGVSCGGGTATTLPAIFPDVDDGTVMFGLDGASGLLGDIDAAGAGNWSPVPTAALGNRATVTSLPNQNPALGVAGNACEDIRPNSAAAGLTRAVVVTGSGLPAVPAGNTLYLYQIVKYDVSAVNSEYWLRRSQGLPSSDAAQQPLAGPLSSASGLAFTYYKSDGTTFVPGTAAERALVARIGIKVVAKSRARGRANLTDSVTTSVLLRNN